MRNLTQCFKKACKALIFLLKGDFYIFIKRIECHLKGRLLCSRVQVDLKGQTFAQQSWCIMTPPHTLFLAELMAENLKRHGCAVRIEIKHSATGDKPRFDTKVWYVVMCSQVFKFLPPGDRRIGSSPQSAVNSISPSHN